MYMFYAVRRLTSPISPKSEGAIEQSQSEEEPRVVCRHEISNATCSANNLPSWQNCMNEWKLQKWSAIKFGRATRRQAGAFLRGGKKGGEIAARCCARGRRRVDWFQQFKHGIVLAFVLVLSYVLRSVDL